MTWPVKSCGRSHASCKECRSDLPTRETRAKMSGSQKGRVFSDEHRAKLSAALRGKTLSAETRAKMSLAHRTSPRAIAAHSQPKTKEHRRRMAEGNYRHMDNCDGACGSAMCTSIQSPTQIENTLVDVVLAEFPEVQREVKFGRYRVDAYLPAPYHLAFEADGTYWHREGSAQADKDVRRDAYLLAEHGLPVVRMTENELSNFE